jgi:hypothetical protein
VNESVQLAEKVASPQHEIERVTGEAVRVQAGPEDVERRGGGLVWQKCNECGGGLVGDDDVPVAVEHEPGIRRVGMEEALER